MEARSRGEYGVNVLSKQARLLLERTRRRRDALDLRYPFVCELCNFQLDILRVIGTLPCRRLQTRCTITLMDDEELTIVGLVMVSSDIRYAIRAACCHSGLGMRPHYVRLMAIGKRWLESPSLIGKVERFVRGDGWCFDVACLRWKSMASARFARESIRDCGTLRPRTQDGDGRAAQLHVPGQRQRCSSSRER